MVVGWCGVLSGSKPLLLLEALFALTTESCAGCDGPSSYHSTNKAMRYKGQRSGDEDDCMGATTKSKPVRVEGDAAVFRPLEQKPKTNFLPNSNPPSVTALGTLKASIFPMSTHHSHSMSAVVVIPCRNS